MVLRQENVIITICSYSSELNEVLGQLKTVLFNFWCLNQQLLLF